MNTITNPSGSVLRAKRKNNTYQVICIDHSEINKKQVRFVLDNSPNIVEVIVNDKEIKKAEVIKKIDYTNHIIDPKHFCKNKSDSNFENAKIKIINNTTIEISNINAKSLSEAFLIDKKDENYEQMLKNLKVGDTKKLNKNSEKFNQLFEINAKSDKGISLTKHEDDFIKIIIKINSKDLPKISKNLKKKC